MIRVRATRGELNQVTAGQVKVSIEDAYEKANLREFEKYTGELWTRDRLLVRTLRYATKNLGPYFEGVGAKGPSMDDLKDLFAKSAHEVFAKALETNEIIGVSKSFDRFIRTIYEYSDTGDRRPVDARHGRAIRAPHQHGDRCRLEERARRGARDRGYARPGQAVPVPLPRAAGSL